MVDGLVLFCPPKILLETPESDWAQVLGPKAIILTDAGERGRVQAHLPNHSGRIEYFEGFNSNPLVELRALELADTMSTDVVIALAEIDVLRAARVKDRRSRGETRHEERSNFFRDKYIMKRKLAEHGIRVHPMQTIGSALDLKDFIDRYGFPVVVKPRDGRGSDRVLVLRSPTDMEAFLVAQRESTLYNMMVERFVEAPMIHVNGLYVGGEPVFITPVRANIGCLDFLEGHSLGVAMLDKEDPLRARIVDLTRRILEQALPSPRNLLFYLELFVCDGELVVCEIASRLGGNGVNQEIIEAFGVNPRLELIRAERGTSDLAGRIIEPIRQVGYIAIPPRVGTLIELPEKPVHDFVRSYNVTAKRGERYGKMKLTNAEVVCAVLDGPSEQAIAQRLGEFDRWVRDSFIWAA